MPELIVYSRASCAPCQTLKYWLKQKGILYKEMEPDDTIRMVPTIVAGGVRIEGLNFPALGRLIASRKQA